MRYKVTMIDKFGKLYEETIIANNEYEAKINVHSSNPTSKIVDAKWVYK
tara:strand:+ start:62 stop:208 length:147 start_codon:yes stop_codon:yes gene_type:complete